MRPERNVLQGCGLVVVVDSAVRQHRGVERIVEDRSLLLVAAIDAQRECTLEVIASDQFARDIVGEILEWELALHGLKPWQGGVRIAVGAILRSLFCSGEDGCR